jgi:excisionase family DNA binding protein
MSLLTADQVAEILGVTRLTVYRQVYAGELRPVKIGRMVRFEPQEIDDFIARNRTRDRTRPAENAMGEPK